MRAGTILALLCGCIFGAQMVYAQLAPSTVNQKVDPNSPGQIEAQRKYDEGIRAAQPVSAKGGLIGLIPCTKPDAGDPIQGSVSGLNCNSWDDFIEVLQFFINYAFVIATVLATVSFAFAGWLYLTSNGNQGQVEKAHRIFGKVLMGFLYMSMAWLLVKTILSTIAQDAYNKLQ